MKKESSEDAKKTKSAEILKDKATDIKAKYTLESKGPVKVINGIISVLFTGAVAFAWMLLMLLIISFVSLSYFSIKIDRMLLISAAFGVIAAGVKTVMLLKRS